ncbi:MAG: hypothetical protein D3910_07000, partial [Candidatus Electrothrix sp. ATG2]|nr:hypothetical protein [Candidatus Electrothrix sp. ATG2]
MVWGAMSRFKILMEKMNRIKYILKNINENEILAVQLLMFLLQAAERFVYATLIASMIYGFRTDLKSSWTHETRRAGQFVRELVIPFADSVKNLTDTKGVIDTVRDSATGGISLFPDKIKTAVGFAPKKGAIVPYKDYKAAVTTPISSKPPEIEDKAVDGGQK